MGTQVGFTGDVMLGRVVNQRQRRRPVTAVWGNLLDDLQSLDGLFINLECCLSTRGTPWNRTNRPFHFRADPDWALPALEAAGVDGCALANNHVLDYEVPALEDTLDHLTNRGIAHAGAGRTAAAAFDPALVTVDDLQVAFFALTDNTPEYAATETTPGTAYVRFDRIDDEFRETVTETIADVDSHDPDLVVASLHWGPNMVEEPAEAFRAVAHWLIDKGVDLIHGHSAHVFHGIEVYRGRPILYDTGDFVDDYAVDRDLRNDRSFLFTVTVSAAGTPTELRLQPTEIYDCAVHKATGDAKDWCRERIQARSAPFDTSFNRDGDDLVVPLAN